MMPKNGVRFGRKINYRHANPKIVIICEGTETEPNYFARFPAKFSKYTIRTRGGVASDAIGIIKYARNIIDDKSCDIHLNEGDKLFCVFDTNGNSDDNLRKALNEAKKFGIDVCISNPCFELWFLLHFQYYTTNIDCRSVINKLRDHLPDYEKNLRDVFSKVKPHQDVAIKNADNLQKMHECEGRNVYLRHACPCTNVSKLIYLLNQKKIP